MPSESIPTDYSVAVCQLAISVENPPQNRGRAREAIRDAAAKGANIVVLPELANTGYVFANHAELVSLAEQLDGPTITEWARLAAELNLVIVAGFAESENPNAPNAPSTSAPEAPTPRVFNSAAIIDPTGVRAVYRKAHLWNTEKDRLFTAGDGLPPVVDTQFGRIGAMICYDLEFPEWVRHTALAGADILCCPVNWPLFPRPEGERPAEIIRAQAAASTNRMFLAVADRVGTERGVDWVGGSVVLDADGFPATRIQLGIESIQLATLPIADARSKAISPHNDVHADRRTDLY